MIELERTESEEAPLTDDAEQSVLSVYVDEDQDTDIFLKNIQTLLTESTGDEVDAAGDSQGWIQIQEERDREPTMYVNTTRQYLNEIGETPLLTAEQEVSLGRRIQAGLRAQVELSREDLSNDERQSAGTTDRKLE